MEDILGRTVENLPKIAIWTGLWTAAYFLFTRLSRISSTYETLPKTKKADWNIRLVSQLHAILICALSFPLLFDEHLLSDKVFSYSSYSSNVYCIATGYFVFDTFMSLKYFSAFGFGFVIHGLACSLVYGLCMRPYMTYYGVIFLFFELSTPFLNIHWFFDKMGMTGSLAQLINGILLVVVFFCVRILLGFYYSLDYWKSAIAVMNRVPLVLTLYYMVANIILNSLNVFWFYKMILALQSRFGPGAGKKKPS